MDFNLIDIVVSVKTADAVALMLKLMQRGGQYSEACRDESCRWPLRSCATCSHRSGCAWHAVFGQELSCDPDTLRRHQKPPLPFAFSFQPENNNLCLDCRLVVVGRAIQRLEMMLKGFEKLLAGLTGRFQGQIAGIAVRDYQGKRWNLGDGATIMYPENLMVLSADGIVESRSWGNEHIEIQLFSPLKIMTNDHQVTVFQFNLFARSILRRVSSFACYFGDCELAVDFKNLSLQTERVVVVSERFIFDSMPGGSRKLAGIRGEGNYMCELNDLMPFLIIGSYINAGKGASFGMGHFGLTLLD